MEHNTIDNNQHAVSVWQKPKKARKARKVRKVRFRRNPVNDVPTESLNDSDTEHLPGDAPLW